MPAHVKIREGNLSKVPIRRWKYRTLYGVERQTRQLIAAPYRYNEPLYGKTALNRTHYGLDHLNRQVAVYQGLDAPPGLCTGPNGSTRMWASEYLLYDGLGQHLATNIPRGNVMLPEFRITDYLGNTRLVLGPGATLRDTFSYTPFGNVWSSNAMVEGKPRLSFIGKEIDRESGLGDYGARKYEPSYGRFTSVDPHWEKYRPLSPYNYSNNNPITAIDADGRDIIVLIDHEGAGGFGHDGVLIGNDETGWWFFSKCNDPSKSFKGSGDQEKKDKKNEKRGSYFRTLKDFAEARKGTSTKVEKEVKRELSFYDGAFRIKTNSQQDQAAMVAADRAVNSDVYESFSANCSDAVVKSVFAARPALVDDSPETKEDWNDLISRPLLRSPNQDFELIRRTVKGEDVTRQVLPKPESRRKP